MTGLRRFVLGCAAVFATAVGAHAEPLTVGTWNLEGPVGLDGRDVELQAFARFVGSADVVVIQETLGRDQMADFLRRSELGSWSSAVSDFSDDRKDNPYRKLEVAVITPHRITAVHESDPYDVDDAPDARDIDRDVVVPDFIPAAQRGRRGSRGWLWVEIGDLKLVVLSVHLKSSGGKTGLADEQNSHKREAITAALAVAIATDRSNRPGWSYVVAGDFNVAPGDAGKVGADLSVLCKSAEPCTGYDQTHAILSGGFVPGLAMRNLVEGLSASYAKGDFVQSPIDNIYAAGPIFDKTTSLMARRGDPFGSDHHALIVTVE